MGVNNNNNNNNKVTSFANKFLENQTQKRQINESSWQSVIIIMQYAPCYLTAKCPPVPHVIRTVQPSWTHAKNATIGETGASCKKHISGLRMGFLTDRNFFSCQSVPTYLPQLTGA